MTETHNPKERTRTPALAAIGGLAALLGGLLGAIASWIPSHQRAAWEGPAAPSGAPRHKSAHSPSPPWS
ncbi:hypothetical protein [Sinomonas gamaensis]|uniref:hypothetical protein n=1 Tax=Sinomonas gamaensis TaxID=2565624 RepID=UPI00110867CD|nr:hypothetical protein [Sinomonas gamaensis]